MSDERKQKNKYVLEGEIIIIENKLGLLIEGRTLTVGKLWFCESGCFSTLVMFVFHK